MLQVGLSVSFWVDHQLQWLEASHQQQLLRPPDQLFMPALNSRLITKGGCSLASQNRLELTEPEAMEATAQGASAGFLEKK